MSDDHSDPSRTALLFVDTYNKFLSQGGKLWPMVKAVAGEVGLLDHLRAVMDGARSAGVKVFILPHRRLEPEDYEGWDHVIQASANRSNYNRSQREHGAMNGTLSSHRSQTTSRTNT